MSHMQQGTFSVDKSEGALMLLWRELSQIGVFVRNEKGNGITITCSTDVWRSARELIEEYSYSKNVTADAAGARSDDLPNYDVDPPEPQPRADSFAPPQETVDAGSDSPSPTMDDGPANEPEEPTELEEQSRTRRRSRSATK